MKSSLYVPKNTCKSSLLSLITAEIESIDYSSFVNLTTNQTIGGSKTFSSSIILPAGSTSSPSLSFIGDPDTGIYNIGANQVGFASNATLRFDYNDSRLLSTIPMYFPSGSSSAPSITFANDAGNNTGLYLVGADQIGFSAGGTLRWDYSTSRISSTIPIRITNGTTAVPSLTFSTSDTDTGLYSPGDGAIEISANAGRIMRLDEGAQLFYARTGGVERFLFNSNTTSGDVFQVYQTRGSTAAYFFYSNAGTFGTVSDRKLKKNIQDVQISKASQLVKLMIPKKYEWNDLVDGPVVSGFIAQDLKEAVLQVGEFERLISEDEYGTLRLAHDQMIAVLAASLKDVLDRLEKLEKKSS